MKGAVVGGGSAGHTVQSDAGTVTPHMDRKGVGSVCDIVVKETPGSSSDPCWNTENRTWCLC